MSPKTRDELVGMMARAIEPSDWCWDEKFPADDRAVAVKHRAAAMDRVLSALSAANLAVVPKECTEDMMNAFWASEQMAEGTDEDDVNAAIAAGNLLLERT